MSAPSATTLQAIGAVLFAIAIAHTFATGIFERLADRFPRHAGIWHLLGEVEVVFGFWALVLVLAIVAVQGREAAVAYVESRNFTEPVFVFAIMVIAATRPILQTALALVRVVAALLPLPGVTGFYIVVLTLVPLLGSFITEPAAMTMGALILMERVYAQKISERLKYATLGVLFVNVSIGGTLTSFAAPPVLMVAGSWGWDSRFMLTHFGWKAALAVVANAVGAALVFRRELAALQPPKAAAGRAKVPWPLVAVHLAFLAGVVFFAHHAVIVLALLMFFLGVAHAYERWQDRLVLREGLLVAFFLAGLVVLGGMQQWWLKPLLTSMTTEQVFWGATALTAVTDNAALTYLGSLVPDLSEAFRYALVAGAVTGGGLTVIANAPNPAGMSILRGSFQDEAVSPLRLLLAAALPTAVAAAAFRLL